MCFVVRKVSVLYFHLPVLPRPKQCLYLESYIAHLLKKDVLESPFMIHSFIRSITVPVTSYVCFCFSQQIYR